MKRIGTSVWSEGTTPNGMPKSPYWPEPKSGHSVSPLREPMYALEFGLGGACETSVFHGLSFGNTGQPPIVGLPANASLPVGGVVEGGVPPPGTAPAGDEPPGVVPAARTVTLAWRVQRPQRSRRQARTR